MKKLLNKVDSERLRGKSVRAFFLSLLFVTLPLAFIACPGNKTQVGNNNNAPAVTPAPVTQNQASPASATFDGERAFEQVRKQVEFGPRPAGSAELAKTQDYIINELKSYGLSVTTDEWMATTPVGERRMVNVTAEITGESADVIMLTSHYDTKLFKEFRFVGANDAGSSTGALLEIARVLAANKQKPRFTYWLTFFDGEEAFCADWDDCHNPNPANPAKPLPDNTYGSRRFVSQLIDKKEVKRVRAMILLDMVGYKNLEMPREGFSAAWLTGIIWQTAREIGDGAQFVNGSEDVDDDHTPFLQAGIDSVDLIQLSGYPYWHTAQDTLDQISAKSLKAVGETVVASLPRIEERLANKPKS
ncbi:MAG: M28 family metallopeptidase [Pyrinomonadaceae bacterium]